MENENVIEGAMVPASQMNLAGVLRIPAVRQVVLLLGVAAAVAAGIAIVLWSQTPSYTQLYADLGAAEAADVAAALRSTDIDFKVDNGIVMVAEGSLYDARMQLASQGLGQGAAVGMHMLAEQSSFGVSQFMESARYQHMLEAELARTISSLGAVREARVHLALPRQTTFIRDRKSASASVSLQLANGGTLEAAQASAIVHLVASSVPNLAARNVTLVDQFARLLSSGDEQAADVQANSQFKFSRRMEDSLKSKIEEMLTKLVGVGRVQAQVVADIDFTMAEETKESFDPANTVIRSEQINVESRSGDGGVAAGVPGALSNQPPETVAAAAAGNVAEQTPAVNTSRSSVRNYEVDRTISHTRPSSYTIRKLSVAVLLDDSPLVDAAADGEGGDGDGEGGEPSLSAADITLYTSLVKEAVGFIEARGDTVVVISAPFHKEPPLEVSEPPAFWEKPLLRDALKQILGAVLVLALTFGVVRPMLRGVMDNNAMIAVGGGANYMQAGGAPQLAGATAALPPPKYEEKVAAAKNITGQDPARVAQVVKQWVSADD